MNSEKNQVFICKLDSSRYHVIATALAAAEDLVITKTMFAAFPNNVQCAHEGLHKKSVLISQNYSIM
jgi:hypothetical protein